jgi:hypothetical protein
VPVHRQNYVRIGIVGFFCVANKQSAQHYPAMFRMFIMVIIWLLWSLSKSEYDLRIENLPNMPCQPGVIDKADVTVKGKMNYFPF